MNIRTTVINIITSVAEEQNKTLLPLVDDLSLTDSGLDSICMAIIVAQLEDELALDPFSESDDLILPFTIGDLIQMYENAHLVKCRE